MSAVKKITSPLTQSSLSVSLLAAFESSSSALTTPAEALSAIASRRAARAGPPTMLSTAPSPPPILLLLLLLPAIPCRINAARTTRRTSRASLGERVHSFGFRKPLFAFFFSTHA